MADDSEMRMEALKKAYAEIILNTSKEAATRVMAAERKALFFRHDLVSLKEESLSMFLRLKEDFNSKILEAEARSFNQQMKIEELEAQLSEAEGIIVDLRDELNQVQEKLEIMRHNQKQPLSGHGLVVDEPAPECVLQDDVLNSSPMIISPGSDGQYISLDPERNVAPMHPTAQTKRCHAINNNGLLNKSDLDQFHAANYDITSIIMENREAELYKNGCTQRIRAIERNLSSTNLPSSSEGHRYQPTINVQSEMKLEEAGNSSQCPMTDTANVTGKPSLFKERMDNDHPLKTVNVTVASTKEAFSVFSSENDKKNVRKIPNSSEGQVLPDCSWDEDETIRSLRRSARKNSRYREAIAALKRSSRKKCIKSWQQPFPCQCQIPSSDVNGQSFINPIEITEKGSKNTELCCASSSDEMGTSDEIIGKFCEEGNFAKRRGLGEELYRVSEDVVLLDAQLFDVPISEGFGSTEKTQNESGNERHLKFTFYRKRRKNVLGKIDENIILYNGTVKKEVENPTDAPVKENRNVKDELNSEGGGEMQIAHQLVSLSGKES